MIIILFYLGINYTLDYCIVIFELITCDLAVIIKYKYLNFELHFQIHYFGYYFFILDNKT